MAGAAARIRASRAESARLAARTRNEKIFLVAGGLALVALLAIEGPGTIGKLTGSGARPTPPLAKPVAKPLTGAQVAETPATPARIARFAAKDVFAAQISSPSTATGSPSSLGTETPAAPAVRARGFVDKDVFAPQVALPVAPAATPLAGAAVPAHSRDDSQAGSTGGTYIVVLASIPVHGGEQAAARAVVAARNAGLKDVIASDGIFGASAAHGRYTVFTGPYPSAASAHGWLVRAFQDGYPHAVTRRIPSSGGGGF